jgi:hypothetical protein
MNVFRMNLIFFRRKNGKIIGTLIVWQSDGMIPEHPRKQPRPTPKYGEKGPIRSQAYPPPIFQSFFFETYISKLE